MLFTMSYHFIFFLPVYVASLSSEQIDLNGQWLARADSPGAPYFPANVPGNVYSDLQRNGTLTADVYYRFKDVEYRWVAQQDWLFITKFTVPASWRSYQRILLKCDGLDTVATVSLNKAIVGSTDNQFRQYLFDIGDAVKFGLSNVLSVTFRSPTKYATEKFTDHIWKKVYVVPPSCPPAEQHGECHVNFIRKAQSSFSWDWGPAFPTVGIWRNISVVAFNTTLIEALTVSTTPLPNTTDAWQLAAALHLITAPASQQQQYHVRTSIPELGFDKLFIIALPPNNGTIIVNYTVPNGVQEWWPNGYGQQKLYNLTISIEDSGQNVLTSKAIRIGFRTVQLVQEKLGNNVTGLTYKFHVNGVDIFAKGSNWIPAHALQDQVTPANISRLLQSAVDANMNMLRVWGGGYYESDVFYETCDRLGLLIWQDFMFACAMYPTTEDFLASVRQEVRDNVLRLQHHPSIALWSANNENEAALVENWYGTGNDQVYRDDYVKLYIGVIRDELLKHELSSRDFVSSSPSDGKLTEEEGWIANNPRSNLYGDAHYYNYLNDPWDWRQYPPTRFASEYGFQSWESVETLAPYTDPQDLSYLSPFANHRQHHPLGQTEMLLEIQKHFRIPEPLINSVKFPALVYLTQINQAMGLKVQTEYYRRIQNTIFEDSSGSTMGALYWQLNSIWPAPSWSSLEFGGKWKIAHYYAKNFFEPVLLSPYIQNDTLWVSLINDQLVPVNDRMTVKIYSLLQGIAPMWSETFAVSQRAQAGGVIYAIDLGTFLPHGCQHRADCLIVVELQNTPTASNFLLLGSPKDTTLPKPNIRVYKIEPGSEVSRVFTVHIETDNVALFVWMDAPGIQGRFSHNGFIMCNATKQVVFYSESDITTDQLRQALTIITLFDIY